MYVPRNREVLITFADGSVAKVGKSCMNVEKHVRTAATPTKLKKPKTFF